MTADDAEPIGGARVAFTTVLVGMVGDLADALEAAEAERDAALAKIAAIGRVESWPELEGILRTPAAILNAGSDVMAEAKAAAWDEGAAWRHQASGEVSNGLQRFNVGYPTYDEVKHRAPNPYRSPAVNGGGE